MFFCNYSAMAMRFPLFLLALVTVLTAPAQSAEERLAGYLEQIRHDRPALTAFFAQMPKGGDLHHHLDGSIYAETYLEALVEAGYWLHTETLDIRPERPRRKKRRWINFRELAKSGRLTDYRDRLIRRWSVKDYALYADAPPDRHFFNTFGAFLPGLPAAMERGLLNIKKRAVAENVQYIETISLPATCTGFRYPEPDDALMRYIQNKRDEEGLRQLFEIIFEDLETAGLEACARTFAQELTTMHDTLGIDDEQFTLRYQTYVLRIKPPTEIFADMALNFAAAAQSPLIVGVNIVAPEHHPVALSDYWLHMQMYRFLSDRFPNVQKALHAGELVLGLVPPEALTWHIRAAVEVAGADRLGHGVSLPHETDWMELARQLRSRDIPVEVCLSSNDFILQIDAADHPLTLLEQAGVPLVISTDDAGVLRTNLTEQYVLLAQSYPQFSYPDIKRLVFNSIRYSFVEEPAVKRNLEERLRTAFAEFEQSMTAWIEAVQKD